jgi:hypothetical protein
MATHELDAELARLAQQFPGVPQDHVASILGDCYREAVESGLHPLRFHAERLARSRLECHTRPAGEHDMSASASPTG